MVDCEQDKKGQVATLWNHRRMHSQSKCMLTGRAWLPLAVGSLSPYTGAVKKKI